jgi:hypothetical protein
MQLNGGSTANGQSRISRKKFIFGPMESMGMAISLSIFVKAGGNAATLA